MFPAREVNRASLGDACCWPARDYVTVLLAKQGAGVRLRNAIATVAVIGGVLLAAIGPNPTWATAASSAAVVSAMRSVSSPRLGTFVDGPAGTPHYVLRVTAASAAGVTGSLSFEYQDGRIRTVLTFGVTGRSGTKSSTPSISWHMRAVDIAECGSYFIEPLPKASCSFTPAMEQSSKTELAPQVGSTNPSCIYTPADFANAFLNAIPEPDTPSNVEAIVGWEEAEGGNWQNDAKFNPLDTTYPLDGSTPINSVGVQSFGSWTIGVTATLDTIENGLYGGILSALSVGNNAYAVADAVGASPWGTPNFSNLLPPNYDPPPPPWEPTCSGGSAFRPAAVVNSSSAMNAFFADGRGNLVNEFWQPNTGWNQLTRPGGTDVAGNPTVIARTSDSMDVAFRTPSGTLAEDYWSASNGWVNQTLPGGSDVGGDPTAVANSPSWMNVFFRTPSGTLAEDYWTASGGWVNQTLPGGSDVAGNPTVIARTSGSMDVAFRTPSGTLAEDYWSASGGWVNQTLPGGTDVSGDPTAVANSPSWMSVFFRTPNGALAQDYWFASNGWVNQSLPGGSDEAGTPSVIARTYGSMDVAFRTPSGTLAEDYWSASGGWVNQTLPGGTDVSGDPTAVANSPSWMNIFFRTPIGALAEDYWYASNGWVNQTLPGGAA
jgi:hypothetical protein